MKYVITIVAFLILGIEASYVCYDTYAIFGVWDRFLVAQGILVTLWGTSSIALAVHTLDV